MGYAILYEQGLQIFLSLYVLMSFKEREKSAYFWPTPALWHHFMLNDVTSSPQWASEAHYKKHG